MTSVETPVLIVGAGPVGLTLALDLARRGTRSTVVERDAGTALELLAKAGTLNERSMEYARWLGIADVIINVGFPDDHPRDTVYCTSLNGFVLGRDPMPSTNERTAPPQTPEVLRKCPQHLFDPLLAEAVSRCGLTDVHYDAEVASLDQGDHGFTVELARRTGGPLTVRAQYVVGCDGAASAVRKTLGVALGGQQLDHSVSVMVRIEDLASYHPLGVGERYMFVGTEGTWANLTAVDGRSLYRLTMVGSEEKLAPRPDRRRRPGPPGVGTRRRAVGGDAGDALAAQPVRRRQLPPRPRALGRRRCPPDLADRRSRPQHRLGRRQRSRLDARCTGARLGRRGVARRLQLRASVHGDPQQRLLDPQLRGLVQTLGRDHVLADTPEGEAQRQAIGAQMSALLQQEWWSLGVGLGYRYDQSPIVIADGTPPSPDDASDYVPTARPGHRGPHAWLADGRSTIDLFGDGFTLLRFGAADCGELAASAARVGLPLSVVTIEDPDIATLYERALVLVRPDGMVAWRGDTLPADVEALIDTVRGAVGARSARPQDRTASAPLASSRARIE